MKKSKIALKKLTAILLSALLITSLPVFHLSSYAAEAADNVGATSGTTGDCTWVVENGVLTISGGRSTDNYYKKSTPWKNCSFNKIVIEEGVKSLGEYVFNNLVSVTSVTIPNSVNFIAESAFIECTSLTNVIIPNNDALIAQNAFKNCRSLTNITIPDEMTFICNATFSGCEV